MARAQGRRASLSVQSEIRVMSIECERVKGINLAQGVCDTEVPVEVRRGEIDAIESGLNSYTRAEGLAEIRNAIAGKMRGFNGIECDPETEVVVNSGSTGSFYCACLALLNPGDEVILFEPYYGYHLNTLIAVEAKPVFVALHAPDWNFSFDDLERAATPRTRAIVINSPSNPSGTAFTWQELQGIAGYLERYVCFVFSVENYRY